MFLRNSWYVAAYSREVTRFATLARTIMNEKIVFFRTHAGLAVALQDRCPHRYAPLSIGKMTREGIACAYHGMEFDSKGKCTRNPTQPDEKISPKACVRAYPLEERHGMLWIWPGDPLKADPELIPDFWYYDHPDWDTDTQYMHVKGNYMLLVDNLLDLSHVNFVHAGILGDPDRAQRTVCKTKQTERGVVSRWLMPEMPMIAGWAETIKDSWAQANVDFWIDMFWEPAGTLMLDLGVKPVGASQEQGLKMLSLDALTPESVISTHYFFGTSQAFHRNDKTIIDFWRKAQAFAFEQDKVIIEHVQANMGKDWDILTMAPLINKGDRAAILARRIMRKLRDDEASESGQTGTSPATQEVRSKAETTS